MKKLIALLFILFMLAACTKASEENTGTTYEVIHVTVDGQVIPCVITGNAAIDCDWSKLTRTP